MQIGTTSIHYSSNLKIESQENMSISTGSGGMYLMPATDVNVSGNLKCSRLYVNGVEITSSGNVAVFG